VSAHNANWKDGRREMMRKLAGEGGFATVVPLPLAAEIRNTNHTILRKLPRKLKDVGVTV